MFAAAHSALALPSLKRHLARGAAPEPRWYRLAYNLLSLALFAWAMAAWRSSQVLYFVPGIMSLALYALQAVLMAALYSCVRQTGIGYFLGTSQLRNDTAMHPRLVTGGWYAISRHPLYLHSLLFMILSPVMTAQWLALTIFSAIYFIAGALVEEKRLLREFGGEYIQYRQRVPFLIPLPGRVRPPSS